MTPRSILAVTDFSAHAHNAMNRAALLSAEHGAQLRLAYLAYPAEAPPADAANRLVQHALQLSHVHGIHARAAGRLANAVDDLLPEVRAADLVVWGTAPVRNLRSFFLGQPVEALVRSARRPVLVARRSATRPYRSLLVAVNFSESSRALLDLSLSLGKEASVELIHAVSTAHEGKLRYASVPARTVEAYRAQCRRDAQNRMHSFSDSFGCNRVTSTIAHGHPARQVLRQQQRSDSELIVVGKHPASAFTELMLGSVAGHVLGSPDAGRTRADVLIVPHDWQAASSTSAAVRLATEQATARRVRAGTPNAPRGPNPAAVTAGTRLRTAADPG